MIAISQFNRIGGTSQLIGTMHMHSSRSSSTRSISLAFLVSAIALLVISMASWANVLFDDLYRSNGPRSAQITATPLQIGISNSWIVSIAWVTVGLFIVAYLIAIWKRYIGQVAIIAAATGTAGLLFQMLLTDTLATWLPIIFFVSMFGLVWLYVSSDRTFATARRLPDTPGDLGRESATASRSSGAR